MVVKCLYARLNPRIHQIPTDIQGIAAFWMEELPSNTVWHTLLLYARTTNYQKLHSCINSLLNEF